MKRALDILYVFFLPISYLFPYKSIEVMRKLFYVFYTCWIRKNFKQMNVKSPIFLCGGKYISIGQNTIIGRNVCLQCWDKYKNESFYPELSIGHNSSIRDDGHITCCNKILIGNGVRIGPKVLITDNSHGASTRELLELNPIERPLFSKGPVIIEDNVWIGEKASIMPNVKIGKGAIIGANSVVTKDVSSYSIVGGNPARVLKQL
jgi:carbonic anhydrase/acetyltransferase-like protein (isoleucine patch superfamily)